VKLNIVEIREDDKGDLWFLVKGYSERDSSELDIIVTNGPSTARFRPSFTWSPGIKTSEVCGVSYDHDWKPGEFECRRCGADLSTWNEHESDGEGDES